MFCLLVNHAYKDSHYTQHQPQLFTVANGQILEKCENTSRHVLQGEEVPSLNIVNIGVSRCQNWRPLPLPLSSAGWLTSVLSPAPASINNPGYSRSSHCPHQHRHIWSSINIPTNHNTSEILWRNHEECHPLLATEGDQKKETIMHNA